MHPKSVPLSLPHSLTKVQLYSSDLSAMAGKEEENDAVHSLDLIAVSSVPEATTVAAAAVPDLSIDLLRSRSERLLSRLAKR